MKVLIADDNPAFSALLQRICAGVAAEIRVCADGASAVAACAEFQPDWILLDLGLPVLDGLSAAARILQVRPDARIIILTEHRGPLYQEAARRAGARAFVPKDDLSPLLPMLSARGDLGAIPISNP